MSAKRFEEPVPRRDFLGLAAVGTFLVTILVAFLGIVRLPKPAVLPESASRFKIGFPEDLPLNSHHFIGKRNVWIFRDARGFYALSAICTHLGCILSEKALHTGYKCPCHGSEFDAEGRVQSGPAPRGMDWLEVSLAADGRLMVDAGKTVTRGTKFNV
ncbi:MAG: ubiquinol-cytochrome c reductase iron-sulfur subunit [Dehalococcoidia bacterium]